LARWTRSKRKKYCYHFGGNEVKINLKLDWKKVNKKMLIVGIVLLAIVIYVAFVIFNLFLNPTDTVMIENGKLYMEEAATGYIIRDEEVVQGKNYKNGMLKIKNEGERVAKDEAIFRYYTSGEEELVKKIQDISLKIQEALENDANSPTGDIKVLEEQIDDKLNSLYDLNDVQKIKEYKKDINTYITKKAKIAGELSPSGSQIKKLYEERAAYEEQLNAGAEYVKAGRAGMVSYRVDGLENVLTPDTFSTLTAKTLEDLNLKTGQIISTSEECGKIIDSFSCYIAVILDSEQANAAQVGNDIKVRLSNSEEIPAEIYYISTEEDGRKLIILKVEKYIQELISYRKISLDVIWWSSSGLKVPNSAIKYENDLAYVVRNRAGYLDKILVKVKKQNDKYAIVDNYDSDELKEMGYTTQQIRSRYSISLYDELIINPDLDKVSE